MTNATTVSSNVGVIRNHGKKDNSPEYLAAEKFIKICSEAFPQIETDHNISLNVLPSIQCYGEKYQDIDLLIFLGNFGSNKLIFAPKSNPESQIEIQSLCLTLEIKKHPTQDVRFEGNKCLVKYNGEDHDVSAQSEGQKYSVRNYIKKNSSFDKAPYIVNLVWLLQVPKVQIPKTTSNLLGGDCSWDEILEKVFILSTGKSGNSKYIAHIQGKSFYEDCIKTFSFSLKPSKIDRKRLEAITKSVLDRNQQQYADKLGKQLLIFRGRGGTGKTVRLLRIAYQAYDEMGLRILFLTYNKALVADLRRLVALLGAKDSLASQSISIKTIHSFMNDWLVALGELSRGDTDFLEKYEEYKSNALEYIQILESHELPNFKNKNSRDLAWDLVMIDESQDWPKSEMQLLYSLYGSQKIIIADGVDQFVRGVDQINWREGVIESQIVPLRKSLRLKSSLCETVGFFAQEIGYSNWNLEPLPESHGGRVILVFGDPFSHSFHKKISATAQNDGNKPIDMLFCVPPSWVEGDGLESCSRVARQYSEWGYEYWDAVNPKTRNSYPTSLEQYRIVQYESCRGLEGWVVVNFALDEFYDYKLKHPEISESAKSDLFFDHEEEAKEYANKWTMIPLTRAIDTLIIHISDEHSYIGKIATDLREKHPETVECYRFD